MYKKYIKRLLDITITIIFILIFWPLFLIICLLVKIVDGGSIFYNKERTGLNGHNFKMYKFKTMNNKKITKLGKFLRFSSLDELPQFINIFKGDMSLIGPRPWIPEYYQRFNNEQKKRANMKPGIIGLAQVNGRNSINILKKIDYDLFYVNNVSFLLDFKIFFKSFTSIFAREDINNVEENMNMELKLLEENLNNEIRSSIINNES